MTGVAVAERLLELLSSGGDVEGPPPLRVDQVRFMLRAKLLELLSEKNVLLSDSDAAGGLELQEFESILMTCLRLGQPLLVGGGGLCPPQLDQVGSPLARARPTLISRRAAGAQRWRGRGRGVVRRWRRRRRGDGRTGSCGARANAWNDASERAGDM